MKQCSICDSTEQIQERRVAFKTTNICDFCWEEYSLPEIAGKLYSK